MTKNILLATAALLAAATISTAQAQTQSQLSACLHGDETFSPRMRLDGCTAVIQSNRYTEENLSLAFYNRGIAHFRLGQYDHAIADFDQALKLDPRSTYALNNRGMAYARKQQYDRAIADFDQAIRINPNHAITYNNRGSAYAKKAQYDRAIADFDRAIALDPNDKSARDNRALAEQIRTKTAHAEVAKALRTRKLVDENSPPATASNTVAVKRDPPKPPKLTPPQGDPNAAAPPDSKPEKQAKAIAPDANPNAPDPVENTSPPEAAPEPPTDKAADRKAAPEPAIRRPAAEKSGGKAKTTATHPHRSTSQSAVGRFFQRTQVKLQNALRAISPRKIF